MKIAVIDGQGGGIGKLLTERLKNGVSHAEIWGIGTNVAATLAMQKAGADVSATGENAILVACRKADVIVGPIGIVIADALFGEITPKIAAAVGQSDAKRILIPINHCDNIVVGVSELSIPKLVQSAVDAVRGIYTDLLNL